MRALGTLIAGLGTALWSLAAAAQEPPAAVGFALANNTNKAFVFYISAGSGEMGNRLVLVSGKSEIFSCGRPKCEVRFKLQSRLMRLTVFQGESYTFEARQGRFNLYRS
jgi:hypothetical protein